MKFAIAANLAFYLGCGALIHALLIGPHFDWSNAWTWGVLLAWPLALLVWFGKWIAIAVAVVCVFALGAAVWERIS